MTSHESTINSILDIYVNIKYKALLTTRQFLLKVLQSDRRNREVCAAKENGRSDRTKGGSTTDQADGRGTERDAASRLPGTRLY